MPALLTNEDAPWSGHGDHQAGTQKLHQQLDIFGAIASSRVRLPTQSGYQLFRGSRCPLEGHRARRRLCSDARGCRHMYPVVMSSARLPSTMIALCRRPSSEPGTPCRLRCGPAWYKTVRSPPDPPLWTCSPMTVIGWKSQAPLQPAGTAPSSPAPNPADVWGRRGRWTWLRRHRER